MTFKSILVHIDASARGLARLDYAAKLARPLAARVVAVAARSVAGRPDPLGLSLVKLRELVETELASAREAFEARSAKLAVQAIWREEMDYPTAALLKHACAADLIVADRNVEADPEETKVGCADLIMASGVPVLTPPAAPPDAFGSVLIGWKNTRETRRAVSDALPLLRRAASVTVMRFANTPAPDLDDVVDKLKLHGVAARGELRARTPEPVAQNLLDAARDIDAKLIVASGYGHSRLREWALGGVTQGLLSAAELPVLLSH